MDYIKESGFSSKKSKTHMNETGNFPTQPNIIHGATITRERSFVRSSGYENNNKRRSLAFNVQSNANQHSYVRNKPTIDIYRPPNIRSDGSGATNKLNVHAQEFTFISNKKDIPLDNTTNSSSSVFYATNSLNNFQMLSKSSGIIQQQQNKYINSSNSLQRIANRQQAVVGNISSSNLKNRKQQFENRAFLLSPTCPIQYNVISSGVSQQIPLINSSSSGNILQAFQSKSKTSDSSHMKTISSKCFQKEMNAINNINSLQRSKSLSSADVLTRGIAGLGLALGNDATDIGQFSPEINALIDIAINDPNKLKSRCLMELTSYFISQAVESRRYALPLSRLCLEIIAKEKKETFLEALLNTCRHWYQEREKLLLTIHGMKSPSRVRLTAFMAFLTEMFCQLKRRQLQLRTHHDGTSPPIVLLSLLSKCCEDCVRPPANSLSEIECLFYVLTVIGHEMEIQLPQQLEKLLSLVRDAFLNASDSVPAIRRTLLQLIELQASHWQLPGNTVLYYYPSTK